MCHAFPIDTSFWTKLYELDVQIAEAVQARGCPQCGEVLHSAVYPRKPRGVPRGDLSQDYQYRLSFCCSECRRRCTPPSVRFLGRKVYLGVIVMLACAISQGLNDRRYKCLIRHLPLSRFTLQRWLNWCEQQLPETPFWKLLQGRVPGLSESLFPIVIFDQLTGELPDRCCRLMMMLMPLTTTSCTRYPTV